MPFQQYSQGEKQQESFDLGYLHATHEISKWSHHDLHQKQLSIPDYNEGYARGRKDLHEPLDFRKRLTQFIFW